MLWEQDRRASVERRGGEAEALRRRDRRTESGVCACKLLLDELPRSCAKGGKEKLSEFFELWKLRSFWSPFRLLPLPLVWESKFQGFLARKLPEGSSLSLLCWNFPGFEALFGHPPAGSAVLVGKAPLRFVGCSSLSAFLYSLLQTLKTLNPKSLKPYKPYKSLKP